MKKIFSVIGFLFFCLYVQAQTSAKRYVLIEHFTNSWCSVCASKNPDFYKTYDLNDKNLHHISYHPNFPYEQCVFYQANKTENNNRAEAYGLSSGTPRVVLNGEVVPPSTPLLQTSVLTPKLGKTSPIAITVKEKFDLLSPSQLTIEAQVSRLSALPAGSYKLFVALVEKNIALTTPNQEKNHRDVFRMMVNGIEGTEYKQELTGEKIIYSYTFGINDAWKKDQVYAVVFLQNTLTKEVLNSGTKFDPVSTGIFEQEAVETLNITPNPVNETAYAQLGDDQAESVEVFSLGGQRLTLEHVIDQSQVQFETAGLSPGMYLVKIKGKKNTYSARMVKQ
jgi:Outer membrane protein Omp28/Secretion system C-terminal sorting domain